MRELTDLRLERRLVEWGQWATSGQRGSGYPTKSVLHESWLPPDPGSTPAPQMSLGNDAERWVTHRAIGQLPIKLQDAVVVRYCRLAMTVSEQAVRLKCSESTLRVRLASARKLIKQSLSTS